MLAGGGVLGSVVPQAGLVDKRLTALLAGDRALTCMRQQVVLEVGLGVGAPAANQTLFCSRLLEVDLAVRHQVGARREALTTNFASKRAHALLVGFEMRAQRLLGDEGLAAGGARERPFARMLSGVNF